MEIRKTFALGRMNKEADNRLLEDGEYRHAENLRFHTNGGKDGAGVNIKGTTLTADLTDGNADFKCVGAYYNEDLDTIYYMLATTNGVISKVCEYNKANNTSTVIAEDNTSILNLQKNGYITGINEINGLLYWVQWGANPRRLNIERAKGYGLNGFTEEDIMVMVKPPLDKLKLTLQLTDSEEENYLEEKMLSFSYQYRYLDGEYSSLAPFTEFAFMPKTFNYDFSEQSNRSMVNAYNQIKIDFNTGNERVTEIRLVFKESQSNTEWIIDDFNKEKLGYADNVTESFLFTNNKIYRALSNNVLPNFYNNVPKTVKSQAIIDGRLIYGYYKEGYNIVDEEGAPIEIDYNLNLIATPNRILNPDAKSFDVTRTLTHTPNELTGELTLVNDGSFEWNNILEEVEITSVNNQGEYYFVSATPTHLYLKKKELPNPSYSGTSSTTIEWVQDKYLPSVNPKKTIKSLRDYEVGMIYSDDFGRGTIVLVSKTNTINIPITNSVTQNQIQVELNHKPPAFATNYRFFIKQNKKGYDQILPTLFYEDGVYRWIKLEGADKDKIKEGDYLTVKRDSRGVLGDLVTTKVLEAGFKDKNFLQPLNEADEVKEKSGFYFKIKPRNFRINLIDFDTYELSTASKFFKDKTIEGQVAYIDDPHFYGEQLDDLTSSGAYTGATGERNRYLIEIDGEGTGVGGEDTFAWSDDDGATWGATGVSITGADQLLSKGVSIKFDNLTGHSTLDKWNINASAVFSAPESRSYAFFRTFGQVGETLTEDIQEKIPNGSTIDLLYEEVNKGVKFEIPSTASESYDNIQEWFIKEDIFSQITAQAPDITQSHIHFLKGVLRTDSNGSTYIDQDVVNGVTTIAIKSASSNSVVVVGQTKFISFGEDNIMVFETEGHDQPEAIFYEIGKTYAIEDDLHKADLTLFPTDQHQTASLPLKVTLDWFNAYSYGNGVESYKIKDEFNRKGLETGIRALTTDKDEYKEVTRKADVTWSDIYESELSFNGLSTFNLAMSNFTKLDQEEGSIQKLLNDNGNLLIFQEDSIGIMPYNKNVIYDTQGGSVVGITTNVLDKASYRPYASGIYGTSNPESIAQVGNRKYFIDKLRGIVGRLSTDGITPLNEMFLDNYFSNLMTINKDRFLVGGFDPKHGEYLLSLNVSEDEIKPQTLTFKERKGFPEFYTYGADFMLYADKELYLWKAGKMYLANSSETRNNFFGTQYSSKLTTVLNDAPSDDKIFKTLFVESNDTWDITLATNLAQGSISKDEFIKKQSHYFAFTRRNENVNDFHGGAVQGIGVIEAINGNTITVGYAPEMVNIGSEIYQVNGSNNELIGTITAINANVITILQTGVTPIAGLFCYEKRNSRVEGGDLRGYYMEVTLENDSTEHVEIFAIGSNIIKSHP